MKMEHKHRWYGLRKPGAISLLLIILLTACTAASSSSPTLVPTIALLPQQTLSPAPDSSAPGYLAPETPTSTSPNAANTDPEIPAPGAAEAYPQPGLPTTVPSPAVAASASIAPDLVPAIAFNAERAYRDLEYQLSLGPRTPGSDAHSKVIEWMQSELSKNGWEVDIQETTQNDQPVRNVIAKRGSGTPWTILGAHFDSRMKADQDPDPSHHEDPVPGANDGASGVAVLMELARVLPADLDGQVWLAFFDAEDQGRLPDWDWILGSRAMAASLTSAPEAVIIVDMIGDANLNIAKERNSDPGITDEVWKIAARLGYGNVFLDQPGHNMLDDHTPFLEKGIRAIDIIDFDYPYWHTVSDTADKVSPQSLKIIGDVVGTWLVMQE